MRTPTTDPRRGVICLGNWILDRVHEIPAFPAEGELVTVAHTTEGLGGGAANVAVNLSALQAGLPVIPAGLVGDDAAGETLRALAGAAGLDTQHLRPLAGAQSGETQVMSVAGGQRTFFYRDGANGALTEAACDLPALAGTGARILYLGYVNLLPALDAMGPDGTTGAGRLLSRARAAGLLTAVDLVSAVQAQFAAAVRAVLPAVDVLFLNELEAARYLDQPPPADDDAQALGAMADRIAAEMPGTVILHSRALAVAAGRHRACLRAEAVPPSQIAGTVGAGDALAAGVLFALHEEWEIADALALGHRMAALSLRTPTATGGIPPLTAITERPLNAHAARLW